MSGMDHRKSPAGSIIMLDIHYLIFILRIVHVGILFSHVKIEEAVIQTFSGCRS